MVVSSRHASPGFLRLCILLSMVVSAMQVFAQKKPSSDADVLVLSNGDTLHGKLVNEVSGKVAFHSDPLGDLSISWDNIKELHTTEKFAVLDKNVKLRTKGSAQKVPAGTLDFSGQAIEVHTEGGAEPVSVPAKNAQYIVDEATLDQQLFHEPGFLAAWNGSATAGATLVKATQNQYTFSGGLGLVRTVPTLSWLNTRNRTSVDFTGSYGKITQPAFVSGGVTVPAVVTKSSIYHLDGERDEYLSARLFALAQAAFDHNFAQDLQLQQIYGAGLGWTALKSDKQELDLKGTIQYEKQKFISGASGTNQNLIGSTFSASYSLQAKLLTYTQNLAYIPAYNNPRAYSASETNMVTFPTYKSLGFTVGTIDTYLNDPPVSTPPTKRNSFQFTMGLSYAIKSKY